MLSRDSLLDLTGPQRRQRDRQPHELIVGIQLPVRRQSRPERRSDGEGFPARVRRIVKCDRFEPVIAGPAVPEIGDAARTVFSPVRRGYRLAALGAGVFVG